MRLNSVRLVNFRQHADSVIPFAPGLTGIIGANGSGKTTILEAIAYAIYGTAAVRPPKDSIRFIGAGGKASVRVELDFELGAHRYRIVRELTKAALYLDGAASPIAEGLSGVTEYVQSRLGMTRGEFFNTYFTGQKELSVMAAMGPTERGQFLSRVLGYERLRAAQEILRKRRTAIVGEITGLRQGMPEAEQVRHALADAETKLEEARRRAQETAVRRRAAESAIAEVQPRWEQAQRERERVQALSAELRVAEGEEASARRDAERLERELAEAAAARAELEPLERELEALPSLGTEARRLEVLAREEGRRHALADSLRALQGELTKLRDRRARLEQAPAAEAELRSEAEARRAELTELDREHEAKHTAWVQDKQEAATKHEAMRRDYQELKAQVDRLVSAGPSGECPTCLQPLGKNFQGVLESLQDKLDTLRVDGRFFRGRVEQLKEPPTEVQALVERRRAVFDGLQATERRLTKAQLAAQELVQLAADLAAKEQRHAALEKDLAAIPPGYDAVRHAEVRREIDRLAPLEQQAARLKGRIEREGQLRRERERVAERQSAVAGRLASLRSQRSTVDFSEAAFADLRTVYDRAAAELRAAELTAVQADSDAASAERARDRAEAAVRELAERQRLLEALTVRRRLHDELDRAYAELRDALNQDMGPELSQLASSLLSELTDGRYAELELDKSYSIVVHEEGIPKPVISGGEEDLVNLVLRLSISQMIAERAGQPLSLLVLDEIFGSLDEARRANVLDLLRRLQDRFEQVILITHIEGVREACDRVIAVRYDEARGTSVVELLEGGGGLPPVEEESGAYLEEAGAAD